jgi:hypothetical protein
VKHKKTRMIKIILPAEMAWRLKAAAAGEEKTMREYIIEKLELA